MREYTVKVVEESHCADTFAANTGFDGAVSNLLRVLMRQCVERAAFTVIAACNTEKLGIHRTGADSCVSRQ